MHRTKRRVLPLMVRHELRGRAGNQCERCGCSGPFAAHHVTPVSEGGTNDLENLMLLCWPCHKAVHRERGDWYAVLMAESPGAMGNARVVRFKRSGPKAGYLFRPNEHCFKAYFAVPWPKTVAMIDRGRLATLAYFLVTDSNMLGYHGRSGACPYDADEIGRLAGLEQRAAYRFIGRMLRAGMMARVRSKSEDGPKIQYHLNPLYYFTGKRLPLNLYLLFRRQLDQVLPEWVVARFAEARNRQRDQEQSLTH